MDSLSAIIPQINKLLIHALFLRFKDFSFRSRVEEYCVNEGWDTLVKDECPLEDLYEKTEIQRCLDRIKSAAHNSTIHRLSSQYQLGDGVIREFEYKCVARRLSSVQDLIETRGRAGVTRKFDRNGGG